METFICKMCGSTQYKLVDGYYTCEYCGAKSIVNINQKGNTFISKSSPKTSSNISLSDDVEVLLRKCRTDRKNARKYANLVLDIDPDNEEALKYL